MICCGVSVAVVLTRLLCCCCWPPAGMNISVQLFVVKWKMIMAAMVVLIAGKVAVMMAAGAMFGLPRMASLRAGRQEQQQVDAGTHSNMAPITPKACEVDRTSAC